MMLHSGEIMGEERGIQWGFNGISLDLMVHNGIQWLMECGYIFVPDPGKTMNRTSESPASDWDTIYHGE